MDARVPSLAIEVLPESSMLSPDAAYAGPAKLEGLTAEDYHHVLRLCPDFVIELRSHCDSLSRVKRKMELWMENGPALGWLVNPDTRTVYCYQPEATGIAFAGKSLSGTGPVEGFVAISNRCGAATRFESPGSFIALVAAQLSSPWCNPLNES